MNNVYNVAWIGDVLELAKSMPSGMIDKNAFTKLLTEERELLEAIKLGDIVEIVLELADILYYVAKCYAIDVDKRVYAEKLCDYTNIPFEIALHVCKIKYGMRSVEGNPKDKRAEYVAVKTFLEEIELI